MTVMQRWFGTAACLCVAMTMVSPASSLAGDHGASAAKAKAKCKKGYVRKGSKCIKKKKVALKVPADGDYSGSGDITLTVATTSGKRTVSVRAMIPLTCSPSGATENVGFLVRVMPLKGTTFAGTYAPAPEFGQTTMSGTFASAKSLHLMAQVAGYMNGADTCTGQLDVTTALRAAR